jgi:Fe-S oxidoreductase
MCMGCRTYCALDQDVPTYIREARTRVVAAGLAPEPVAEIGRAGETTGSPYGIDPAPALAALHGEPSGEHSDTGGPAKTPDVVYVPSCAALARRPQVADAVLAVLRAAGLSASVVHPGCCGGALGDLGHADLAETLRARMRTSIEETGAARVVTDDPVCARTLDAVPFPVFALDLIEEGRLRPRNLGGRMAYHDPCVLGRHLGVYDAPRAVMRAMGIEVAELRHCQAGARCCGGGAGLPATDPEAARAVAAERLDEVRETGVDTLVTASVVCEEQLGENPGGIVVRDLAEVLAEAL